MTSLVAASIEEVQGKEFDDENGESGPPLSPVSLSHNGDKIVIFPRWGPLVSSVKSRSPESSDPFCDCTKVQGRSCTCGEDDTEFEWVWDKETKSPAIQLSEDGREVRFHQEYSYGTAAVRGNQPMKNRQYYWEVKMTTPVYGTDMMVGVGTPSANLDTHRYNFCSLLGSDSESWGLSYTGNIHHRGEVHRYASKFGQGSIIGLHLDMWNGTLTFFKNRQSLGIAYENLQGKTLYPMVSSTAARSAMKVIKCRSCDSSLQYLCIRALRNVVPQNVSLIDALPLPPGLAKFVENNVDWLIGASATSSEMTETEPKSNRGLKRAYSATDDDDAVTITFKRRHRETNCLSSV